MKLFAVVYSLKLGKDLEILTYNRIYGDHCYLPLNFAMIFLEWILNSMAASTKLG